MPRLFQKRSGKIGLPPGTLVHIGEKKEEAAKIRVLHYDEKDLQENEVTKDHDFGQYKTSQGVSWINVDGLHDVELLEKLGHAFGLHPLVMEDVLNTDQRPKVEDYEEYLYIVMKMLTFDPDTDEIVVEQVSLVLGRGFVISFQEREGDIFDPVRERIKSNRWRIRKLGSDYLAYALCDSVVDNYFLILESIGAEVERIEQGMSRGPESRGLHSIHKLKRDLVVLRKAVWPLRAVVSGMQKQVSDLIKESTGPYLRDLYDHTVQVADTIETFRDMLSSLLDMHLSAMSNRMNEVMKTLTVIATIFIPLTFIAGIYGMNFQYMPELDWRYGYFTVLGFMALMGLIMLVYFKTRRWM